MKELHEITLVPHGRTIWGKDGRSLMDALNESSIFLRADCGGKGRCGKCQVNTIQSDGTVERVSACNTRVTGDLTIEIPENSLLSPDIISKASVRFPSSFQCEKKDLATAERYGIAVDLGTTTIAVYLCDRSQRTILSSIAMKNFQALYGDDVMSRIAATTEDRGNLEKMQNLVVRGIEWGAAELLGHHALSTSQISQIVAVGNPTMIHILSGVDPRPIGISPYQPAFYEARTVSSESLGFSWEKIPLHTLPQISGFIGGDIVSAALAADLLNQPDGTLLIDLGTNGELLFKTGDKLFATSCATGPAFEGATLSCGIQAIGGAINKIEIADRHDYPSYTTIHTSKKIHPVGICGTGMISGIAELLRKMILSDSGGFIADKDIKPLRWDADDVSHYVLVEGNAAANLSDVYISQKDVRSVQLGKAAVRTGIEFLSRAAGYAQPEKILLAGAFGTHIDKEDMITIGMLPNIAPERIEVVGNSAGAGAVMVLCDNDYISRSIDLAEMITVIELTTDLRFQQAFIENLGFSDDVI